MYRKTQANFLFAWAFCISKSILILRFFFAANLAGILSCKAQTLPFTPGICLVSDNLIHRFLRRTNETSFAYYFPFYSKHNNFLFKQSP